MYFKISNNFSLNKGDVLDITLKQDAGTYFLITSNLFSLMQFLILVALVKLVFLLSNISLKSESFLFIKYGVILLFNKYIFFMYSIPKILFGLFIHSNSSAVKKLLKILSLLFTYDIPLELILFISSFILSSKCKRVFDIFSSKVILSHSLPKQILSIIFSLSNMFIAPKAK